MKKAVRKSIKGASNPAGRFVPMGTVNTVATAKAESQPQLSASPTPVWSRYVDSRLKQFCLR